MKYIIFDGSDINKIKNYKFLTQDEIQYIKIKIYEFLKNNFKIILQEINYIEFHDNISSFFIYLYISKKFFYVLNFNYQGEILEIKQIEKINRNKIDDLCELESFPIYLNNKYSVKIKGSSNIILNDNELNIYKSLKIKTYLDKYDFNTPLYYKNKTHFESENDSYIRFPFYDKENKFAIILNRYLDGLNLCATFVNIKDNIIEQGEVIHYKNAIAIEKLDEKYIRIFISHNDEKIDYIYPDKKEDTSEWYFINIKEYFEKI
jgi:hypothetical protein